MTAVTITSIPLDRLLVLAGLETASLTAADCDRLQSALKAATARIEQITGRCFTPCLATLPHAVDPHDPTMLLLDADLIQLTRLTNGDGTMIDLADIEMIGSSVLKLHHGATFTIGGNDRIKPVQVEGIWGWHDQPLNAWQFSCDEINGTPPDAVTLPVSDADGMDLFGGAPRFRVGQLLRVGLEYVSVTGIDATNNTLSVIRGVQGSSIASHESGSSIFIYQPPAQVERLILRLALWLYKEPDNRADGDIPASLIAEAEALRRISVRA